MLNLRKKSTKKVQLSNLGTFLRLIALEYPDIKGAQKLAEKVSAEFNVICTEEDILGYEKLHIEFEDYELESRRKFYGIIM